MIIQFNYIVDEYARQRGHKMFYHVTDGTCPSDEEVLELMNKHFALDLTRKPGRDFIIQLQGRDIWEAFPIFCTYRDKDYSKIVEPGIAKIPFDHDGWYRHAPELGI